MAISYKKLFHLLIEKEYDKCAVTGGGRLFGKYYYKIET